MFIATFASDDVDVASHELGGEGAVVEGVKEVVWDEGVVCCWAEFVQVDAGCGGEEGALGGGAEAGYFFLAG